MRSLSRHGDPSHSSYSNSDRRGVVLIVVLVLVVMVALAGFAFVGTMNNEYAAVRTAGDTVQAKQTLHSAELMLKHFAEQTAAERELAGGWFNNPDLFRAVPLIATSASGEFGSIPIGGSAQQSVEQLTESTSTTDAEPLEWKFTIIGPEMTAANDLRSGTGGQPQYGLENESSKLHLAAIQRWESDEPGNGRAALMKLPGMTSEIADAILDWIDTDNETREGGAEADFYNELSPPYSPRNDIPQSIDELLLIKGVTEQLLLGFDTDRNYYLDEAEQLAVQSAPGTGSSDFASSSSESNDFGWQRFLTVSSSDANQNPLGNARIDLNNNDLPGLASQLKPLFPPEIVTFIILYRQYGPLEGESSSKQFATEFDNKIPPKVGLVSIADLVDSAVAVPSSVQDDEGNTTETTVQYASPLSSESQVLREWLPKLLQYTSAGPPVPGRINLNLAPKAIVSALPNLSEETVGRIIDQRLSLDATQRSTVAWLMTEGVLSRDSFKAVLPWLTTGGNAWSGQVIVFRGSVGPFQRVEFTIDTASEPIRRIKWRSLNRLGIGFPRSVLDAK